MVEKVIGQSVKSWWMKLGDVIFLKQVATEVFFFEGRHKMRLAACVLLPLKTERFFLV